MSGTPPDQPLDGYSMRDPLDLMREMSGLDFVRGMAEGRIPQASMHAVFNIREVSVAHGHVRFSSLVDGRFNNPLGTVHGGFVATVLDSCMGCAVHTTLSAGQVYTTVEFKISLLRAVPRGEDPVWAEGDILHAGRRIVVAQGRLTDATGRRLFAHATSTCLITPL
jgi:uncharacterized protein (TIGR00369 family)